MADEVQRFVAAFAAVGQREVTQAQADVAAGNKKIEASAAAATAANARQATSEGSLVGSLREASAATDEKLKKTEELFKATDRVAGIIGKATAALGIITLAYGAVTAAYDLLNPKAEDWAETLERQNAALAEQRRLNALLLDAPQQIAAEAGVPLGALTAEEQTLARAIEARIQALKDEETALRDRAAAVNEVTAAAKVQERASELAAIAARRTAAGDAEGATRALASLQLAGAGASAVEQQLRADLDEVNDALRANAAASRLAAQDRQTLVAGLKPTAPKATPTGPAQPNAALIAELETSLMLLDLEEEGIRQQYEAVGVASTGLFQLLADGVQAVGDGIDQAFSLAAEGLALLPQNWDQIMAQVDAVEARMLSFYEGISQSASAAAVEVLVFGASSTQTLNLLGKAVAREALTRAPLDFAKGLGAYGATAPFPNPAADAYFSAAALEAAIGLGGVGLAAATGGVRGGGGGGGGGGALPGPGDFGPQASQQPQGPREVHVYFDGAFVGNEHELGARLQQALDVANGTPGARA